MRGVLLLQRRHQQVGRAFSQCSVLHEARSAWKRNEGDTFKPQPWKRPGLFLQFRCSAGGSGSKKKKIIVEEVSAADAAEPPKESPGVKQTMNFEVKTSKGILSISTTIEDSKINEIVFEKTDMPSVAKLKEPALATSAINLITNSSAAATTAAGAVSGSEVPSDAPIRETETVLTATLPPDKSGAASPPPPSDASIPVPTPKRPRFDYRSSLERNFVTPSRAISDFMLTAADLECLPKIKRRSPYEQEPPMTVYWRRDVEAKALEVWGSKENLLRERLKREVERKQYQQSECLCSPCFCVQSLMWVLKSLTPQICLRSSGGYATTAARWDPAPR